MTNGVMKKKINRHIKCLSTLLMLLSMTIANHLANAEPEPIPGMTYNENFADDSENFLLLQRLKQVAELKREMMEDEQELAEAQYEIQAILEEKARNNRISHPIQSEFSGEETEMLPVPSAVVYHTPGSSSGKRTSYMTLCHFKICNMGRKRQSRADVNRPL